jgi:citrate lyase subunit beta / citryl-CoA lyase
MRWRAVRSLLFAPGDQPRMLQKARASAADAVIYDLEDAVADERKSAARATVREALDHGGAGPLVCVRTSSAQSGRLRDDLEAVVGPGLDGVWLPKAERPEHVTQADAAIAELESQRGLPTGEIALFATFETVLGVWHAHDIAGASSRLAGVSVGTAAGGDLEAEVGCKLSRDGRELDHARSHVLFAAKAAGVHVVIDGAYTDFRDEEGLVLSATAASRLGCTGKMVIHPGQIATVNALFTPTGEEVDYARRVIVAFDAALERGSAVTSVDGKMIDYAMAATARNVLARAEAGARS